MLRQAYADRTEAMLAIEALHNSDQPLIDFMNQMRVLQRRVREANRVIDTIQRNTRPEDLA